MKPMQLWLPLLNSTFSDPAILRDSQHAFRVWRGELTVWQLPEATKICRWREEPCHALMAVRSERLDRLDVCHVGSNGYTFGADWYFPDGHLNGLLDAWLNLESFELHAAPETIALEVPDISKDSVGVVPKNETAS